MVYNVEKLGTINIGRHGENLARVIEIDVSSMLKQWPDATITLLVKRNKDEAPYVAVTELIDGILYWPVTRAETAVPGNGLIEIRATRGETIAKSVTGFIRVSAALTGNETEPPETAKSWVDQVIEYGNEATQAAIKAKEEADRLSGINAKAVTLPEGSEATVTVEDDCLVYGIPKGETGAVGPKGDKGDTGDVGPQGVKGDKGDKGDPGTDATVTKDSIKSALGYTPADDADMPSKLTEPSSGLAVGKYFRIAAIDENGHAVLEAVDAKTVGVQDVQVAGASVVADGVANVPIMKNGSGFGVAKIRQAYGVTVLSEGQLALMNASIYDVDTRISNYRCITPNKLDYAVKAAMCDGKGDAWTADEQAAARERMGIPGDYELIEEITLEEVVDNILRRNEPDGTAYNLVNAFVSVYVPIQDGGYVPGTIWVYFRNVDNFNAGRLYINQSARYSKNVYLRAEQRTSNGIWLNPSGEFGQENVMSMRMNVYIVKTVNSNITGIHIIATLPAGTIIKIYGVRA